jgi:hypothetical protein
MSRLPECWRRCWCCPQTSSRTTAVNTTMQPCTRRWVTPASRCACACSAVQFSVHAQPLLVTCQKSAASTACVLAKVMHECASAVHLACSPCWRKWAWWASHHVSCPWSRSAHWLPGRVLLQAQRRRMACSRSTCAKHFAAGWRAMTAGCVRPVAAYAYVKLHVFIHYCTVCTDAIMCYTVL